MDGNIIKTINPVVAIIIEALQGDSNLLITLPLDGEVEAKLSANPRLGSSPVSRDLVTITPPSSLLGMTYTLS